MNLITSSVFHYEFEFIHPFADGNGRMGQQWLHDCVGEEGKMTTSHKKKPSAIPWGRNRWPLAERFQMTLSTYVCMSSPIDQKGSE